MSSSLGGRKWERVRRGIEYYKNIQFKHFKQYTDVYIMRKTINIQSCHDKFSFRVIY